MRLDHYKIYVKSHVACQNLLCNQLVVLLFGIYIKLAYAASLTMLICMLVYTYIYSGTYLILIANIRS